MTPARSGCTLLQVTVDSQVTAPAEVVIVTTVDTNRFWPVDGVAQDGRLNFVYMGVKDPHEGVRDDPAQGRGAHWRVEPMAATAWGPAVRNVGENCKSGAIKRFQNRRRLSRSYQSAKY